MGSAAPSKLVEQEQPLWEQPHELKIDSQLRNLQRAMIASLKTPSKLCVLYFNFDTLLLEHWYITDGAYIIEFGDTAFQDRSLRIFASPTRQGQTVVKEFAIDDEVKRRLRAVCGATNHSLALRNSEHMAKYIATGRWLSLQMVGTGPLFQGLKGALGEHGKWVNTPPAELEAPHDRNPTTPALIYPDLRSSFAVEFSGVHQVLSADSKGLNMVVLGPTGAGKSSVINTLFNRRVAKVKASPMSVTRHMDVYSGSFFGTMEQCRLRFYVIDSIGFCDSEIHPEEVLQIVKGFIKANVLDVCKVIVVCASRIEKAQADAIKGFMTWLKYGRHKSEFVFLYNKAEHLDEVEREEAVTQMCTLLDADPTHSATLAINNSERKRVQFAFAAGFPPRAPLVQVQSDLNALYDAVFVFRNGNAPIRVSESDCQIL